MSQQQQRAARVVALAQVVFFGVLLAFPQHAFAYAGSTFLNYLANFFIGPLALLAIVAALVSAMIRPELVSKAVWAAGICIVVFFVIREGDTILNMLRAGD